MAFACLETSPTTPLLLKSSSDTDSDYYDNPHHCKLTMQIQFQIQSPHKPLAILSGHVGAVSCLALCGEFVLSASQARDIIVWQQPDLRRFAKFGHGEGSVKALVAVANRVFTAHQDGHIRVWKVSRSSENVFRLLSTLPTTKDYLGNFMKQSNYVQTRRHHRKLWIQHSDSISCLAVHNGVIYSGSWDRSLKVWRLSDFKCLESIRAHEDAINGLVAHKGLIYSASADGKIKIWGKDRSKSSHCLKGVLEGYRDVSWNSVILCEDGRFVYGGGSDGRIAGWEEKYGETQQEWKLVCDLKAHEMSVLCLCSMGDLVCSGSADKSIVVWRRECGGGLLKIGVIRGHEGPVKCLQASSHSVGGGFMLYSGGLDKSLRVWWVSMESSEVKQGEMVSSNAMQLMKNKDWRSLSY
ncbi:hypothetical protein J5N97_014376 [Dioscorea zingiberensis]|uniref:Uncharacterized protein n=1 Tax=Dioscorea zingiberensis TaxID=325984 RepID=A0A9D5HK03_9LILI|nr:hypothetical protein J5N97_014376 [Dioscorea zingiberensis]